jgi:hypothetical protein
MAQEDRVKRGTMRLSEGSGSSSGIGSAGPPGLVVQIQPDARHRTQRLCRRRGGGTGGSDPGIWAFYAPKSPAPFLSSLRGSLPPVPQRSCLRAIITDVVDRAINHDEGPVAYIHQEPMRPTREQLAVRRDSEGLQVIESYCEFINSIMEEPRAGICIRTQASGDCSLRMEPQAEGRRRRLRPPQPDLRRRVPAQRHHLHGEDSY